jgi:hypothetical protein
MIRLNHTQYVNTAPLSYRTDLISLDLSDNRFEETSTSVLPTIRTVATVNAVPLIVSLGAWPATRGAQA